MHRIRHRRTSAGLVSPRARAGMFNIDADTAELARCVYTHPAIHFVQPHPGQPAPTDRVRLCGAELGRGPTDRPQQGGDHVKVPSKVPHSEMERR